MNVTMKDIAKRANVTAATVSMVINNKPNISQSTRDKVLKIASELNYYPNVNARGLATQRTNAIGVIVPNLASSYVVRILQGIKSTNKDAKYTVQLFDIIGQSENEKQLFNRLVNERRIDGAILIGPQVSDVNELEIFKNSRVPCVAVARNIEFLDSVYANNTQGATEATDYLISKGHKNIACVLCNKTNLPMEERYKGYLNSLTFHEIKSSDELLFMVADDTMDCGAEVFHKIASSSKKITAVFVPAGDMVAIGIIKEAKSKGLNIPEDLAVVGFDDIPAAEVVEPQLTTVRQPKLEMGDQAIDLIIDKIEGKISGIQNVELLTKFIVRNSA